MKILAFDTALYGCSVGLFDDDTGRCVSESKAMPRGQAELLVPMVQDVLQKAEVEFSAIDLVATTIGPGAFTGLRIGLATAQGFGLALQKDVAGVTTTEVLAAMFFDKEEMGADQLLGVLIETKRQDYYCQFYNADGSALAGPQALDGQAIGQRQEDIIFIGDALERFAKEQGGGSNNHFKEGYELPDPCCIARIALGRYQSGSNIPAKPLYLRGADVSSPKKEQRTILEE